MQSTDSATMDPGERHRAIAGERVELRLTVLGHADLSRIGCHAVVELNPNLAVARSHPLLSDGAPLADPFLSRSPVVIASDGGDGVIIDGRSTRTSVQVDGRPVPTTATCGPAQLAGGVVIELGGQVTLLLHRHPVIGEGRGFGLVGTSAALDQIRREISLVADLDVPVLIRGESGVGKELVARAVHLASARRQRQWVSVNMAAVPANLAASTLFGHARGAFSGAVADHDGHFLRAHQGTLFMDEVGDTPPEVQVMLLRALETGEVHPIGARRPRQVDVRLISATDADLEGRADFRGPLLHRLAGFQIHVPPLRERRVDIGSLVAHFARSEAAAVGVADRLERVDPRRPWLPAPLMTALTLAAWPGNVRQLRNVIRQLTILHRDRPALDGWQQHLGRLLGASEAAPTDAEPASSAPARRYRPASEIPDDELIAALRLARFELKAAAAALGVSRTSLYARVERCPGVRTGNDLSRAEVEAALARHPDLDDCAAHLEVSARALKRRIKALGLG